MVVKFFFFSISISPNVKISLPIFICDNKFLSFIMSTVFSQIDILH